MISKGNHVMFARFALLAVRKKKKNMTPFCFSFYVFFVLQLLDSIFCDIQNYQGSGKGLSAEAEG